MTKNTNSSSFLSQTYCVSRRCVRMTHDAARTAQCPCVTLMRVISNNQSPSKLQLWFMRATSRSRERLCVVVKNQASGRNKWFLCGDDYKHV